MYSGLKTQTETDLLFKHYLERNYFNLFRRYDSNKFIELYIRGDCPSKCSYCYLQKHLNELYPREYDTEEHILPNVKKFMDFYIENDFVCNLELFSGRLFQDEMGIEVLKILYDTFNSHPFNPRPREILIPDDMQFLLDKNITKQIISYINKFKNLGIRVVFSASVDGYYIDQFRYGGRGEDFYNSLRQFTQQFDFSFHPMCSASNVKYWVKNYDWWRQFIEDDFYQHIMVLEVRDDNWGLDNIRDYLKFQNHIMEILFNDCNKDPQKYLDCLDRRADGHIHRCRMPFDLDFEGSIHDPHCDGLSCAYQKTLHIRMGDLAIVPCHRLAYPQLTSAYLIGDNHIDEVRSKNASMFLMADNIKCRALPKCSNCGFAHACIGPCLGANYESMGDPFYTPDSVCDLLRYKITFQIEKFKQLGIHDYILKNPHSYSRSEQYIAVSSAAEEFLQDFNVSAVIKEILCQN